jgi:hypothetical protein
VTSLQNIKTCISDPAAASCFTTTTSVTIKLGRTGVNSRSFSPKQKETEVLFSYFAPESPPTTAQVIYHDHALGTKGAVNKILAPPPDVNNIAETPLSQALPVYKGDSPSFSLVAGMKRGISIMEEDDEVDKRTR